MRDWIADISALTGVVCTCYGFYLVWPPLSWIVGGAMLFTFSIIGAKSWVS